MEGTKIVVFGIGGAGCRILDRLAESSQNNTALIALDTDKGLMQSLDKRIEKITIGESFTTKCNNFEEIRSSFNEEISSVEASLDGADLVIAIAGLGGKTGTCIGNFIADLCNKKELFTLFIPIYPLMKAKGSKNADAVVKQIRENVGGVIIVDNNLKREGGKLPMLKVFNSVNDLVINLVSLIVSSISGLGSMNLDRDELMQFFHGELFFVLTSGRAMNINKASKAALEEVNKYAEISHVKRALVLVSSPMETTIEDMKKLNNTIQDRLTPDSIKWTNAQGRGSEISVLLVSAVSELPLVEGVSLPEHIESKSEVLEKNKKEHELQEDSTFYDTKLSDAMENIEKPKLRSQALIGVDRNEAAPAKIKEESKPVETKPEPKIERVDNDIKEDEVDEEEEIDDVVSELIGLPNFKKKGQKRLGDYKDDLGIDYI